MDPELRSARTRLRRDWRIFRPRIVRAALVTILGFVPMVALEYGVLEEYDPYLLRLWFTVRGVREAPPSVTIVRLDKPAYDLVNVPTGGMYPRARLAEMIDTINKAGASMIMLDGIFEREWHDAEANEALVAALSRSPSVIGRSMQYSTEHNIVGTGLTRRIPQHSVPLFAQSAKEVISVQIPLDRGWARNITRSNERGIRSDSNVPLLAPLRRFVSPNIVEPGPFDFINYYGGVSTLVSLSAATVLLSGDTIDPAYFKGRAVFIGIVADTAVGIAGGRDMFSTAFSDQPMPGVEVHATIAANLIDGTWIRRLPYKVEGIVMAIWTGVTTFFIVGSRRIVAVLLTAVAGAVWSTFSYYAFCNLFYFVPAITLCGSLAVAGLVGLLLPAKNPAAE
jgi:CHASE2 domain-containing sensor protein